MKRSHFLLFVFIISIKCAFAQLTLPYTFENNSRYSDDEIYIGLVGKFDPTGDVWMDMSSSTLQQMSADLNTVDGPEWSHPVDWQYPDIFTKLSDINSNTIQIPHGLYGCRIFISFESPMYLRFHATGGYAGANLNSDSDPNDGIRWEIVELTWGSSGLWTNTSRVDAYQYPMALEVTGYSGGVDTSQYENTYNEVINSGAQPELKKIGEVLSHQEILDAWDTSVSDDYLVAKIVKTHSLDGEPIIEQPSKVPDFPTDVLDDYIDDIWSTYANNDLVINIGDRGTWTGRVNANNEFRFTDPSDGSIATIYGKPSTINAIEGSGFLAFSNAGDPTVQSEDLMIQAQITAAITRHAIYTNITNGTIQYTHDDSRFFQIAPFNEYVQFFHDENISFESQTYAFAYDDVGDHSSTIQSTFPTNVNVIIGGYSGQTTTPTPTPSTFIPDPNKTYYIDAPVHNLRIAADGNSEEPYTTTTNTTDADVEWQFVSKGNGSWHIQRAAGGNAPRLRTDNSQFADMQGTAWSGVYTYYDFEEGATGGTYFVTLADGPTNFKRLQINNTGQVKFVSTASNGTWESFTFTEASETTTATTSSFIEAEDYASMNGIQTENTADIGGGLNVGWIDTNDWLEYTINVPSSGTYTLNLRIASPNSGSSANIQVNSSNLGTIQIPDTGSWQSWNTVSTTINLSAGSQTLRLTSTGNGFNINWLEIENSSAKALNNEIASQITLYPNPVVDQLNINLGEIEIIDGIEVMNIIGQVINEVSTTSSNLISINTNNLKPGVYLVRIKAGDQTLLVKKFIK